MRKIFFVFVAAGLLCSIALTSCKKENAKVSTATSTTKNKNTALMRLVDNNFNQAALIGVSKSTQGFLVFTTLDAYDNVLSIIKEFSDEQLNGWENALAFTSAFTAYADPTAYNVHPQNNKNQNFEDPLFSRILDVNGLIQIEDFVFKAAYDNNYVLEMNQSHLVTHYSIFKTGTFDATIMNKFDGSYDEEADLFAQLRGGLLGNTPTTGGNVPFNRIKDKPSDDILTDQAGTQWKAECKTVYQNLPFYCRLFGEMKYTKKTSGILWTTTKTDIKLFSFSSSCDYSPNRKSKVVRTVSDYRNDNKLNYNPYSGSRKHDKFNLSLDFNYYSVAPGWRIVHSHISK
jgi:hypothetical protein